MSRIFTASGSASNHLVSPVGFYSGTNVYFSMFAWVKRADTTNHALMLYRDATTATDQYTEMRKTGDGAGRFGTRLGQSVTHTAVIVSDGDTTVDTWMPVAITSAPADLQVFVSTASNSNGDSNGHATTTNMRLYLGVNNSFSSTNSLTGKLAHCAMWDRQLTVGEVQTLLNGTAVPSDYPTGLVDYWPMTDGATGDEVGINGTVLTMVGTIGTDAGDNPPVGAPTVPIIDNVNSTNTITSNGSISINGTFPSPITSVDYGGHSLSITGQTEETVICAPFDAHDTPLNYAAHTLTVTNDFAESDNISVDLVPPNNVFVVTGVSVDTTYGLAQEGGADGDQWEVPDAVANSAIGLLDDTNMIFSPAVPDGTSSPYWRYSAGVWIESLFTVYGGLVILPGGSLVDAKWAALRGQGFTGAMSDMTLQWLQANGATSSHISDAWLEMLAARGYEGQRNGAWVDLLGDAGYVGSLPDRELQFWLDGGILGGPP